MNEVSQTITFITLHLKQLGKINGYADLESPPSNSVSPIVYILAISTNDVVWFVIFYYYIDIDEIPGFLLLLKNHIFTARSEGTSELKQPRRRRQQKPHKFAYLTMKNSIFARFARAFFISTTWNHDLFCSCVDDVSILWQMFNFVFLCPKRWFQFNSRIVRTHFSSIRSLNNWQMVAETRSNIFRWRYRFRRRRVCLSSLILKPGTQNY